MKKLFVILLTLSTITLFGQTKKGKEPSEFLPKGYVIFEKISGDLNNDSIIDCVLLIKATDKSKIILDKYRGKLDCNRRGIIVLFNKIDHYELALKNYNCFSSENEDGGVYLPPELSIEIKKENLYAHYGHGRYGYWKYTFRYQDSDFVLIGYDQHDVGPINDTEKSINFLTKKKKVRVLMSENNEVASETWENIKFNNLVKLSEIKDFDELDMTIY